ncbi:MAG: methionyl-tRNA formyltransferase [Ilumatobacteraceae bacterium]|nr:methionyl-tRNA formyltransferase [Ilumatobacteraceae bacterium]
MAGSKKSNLPTLVFLGSPEPAVVVLDALVSAGAHIEAVVTQPDAKRGRGSLLSPTPVKLRALEHGLAVTHNIADLATLTQSTLGVVVAYGRIISADILQRLPMLNVHFSLLPRWRGAAPVERAILAGDSHTGVCIMDVEATLDTGAVFAQSDTPIADDDTSSSLTTRLALLGADALIDVLTRWPVVGIAQSGESTYAHKISAAEGLIDWRQSSEQICRQVRALPAYCEFNGQRLRILEVSQQPHQDAAVGEFITPDTIATPNGSVQILRVQPAGKAAMSASDWVRGARIGVGDNISK